MQVFEHFCTRAGLTFGGGVGVGGGVMLNFYSRILLIVQAAQLLLNTVLSVTQTGSFFAKDAWIGFGENMALLLFFHLGVLVCLARMGHYIRKGAFAGKKYTRILVPSLVFVLFADIFFFLISLFEGGLLRGWLAKKKPTQAAGREESAVL